VNDEHKKNQQKSQQNGVDHEPTTVPPSAGRINRLLAYEVLVSVAAKKGTKLADHFDEAFRHRIPASKDGVKAKPFRSLHEP
jgi:hypothetical protein